MLEQPAVSNILLELQVPDFEKVKEYYGNMGFKVVWERKPEGFKGYLVLKLQDNILCFWAGNEMVWEQGYFKQFPKSSQRGYGVELVLMVKDLDGYYDSIKNKIEVFEPLQERPWGLRDFRIADPFGFYLRFTTPHNILDSKYAVK